MGWSVIGFTHIEFNCKVTKELKEDIEKILKKNEESYYNFSGENDSISFDLWGNKGINYKSLIEIQEKFKVYIVEINCREYSETGEGYYYSEDEE